MQSLHSLKCEMWNYIYDRNSHQELDDEDMQFVEDPNNNQAEKFDVIERALMNSEEWFDGATNYDIGKVYWYRQCLENLKEVFADTAKWFKDFWLASAVCHPKDIEEYLNNLLTSYE